jgi:hypothetical protein
MGQRPVCPHEMWQRGGSGVSQARPSEVSLLALGNPAATSISRSLSSCGEAQEARNGQTCPCKGALQRPQVVLQAWPLQRKPAAQKPCMTGNPQPHEFEPHSMAVIRFNIALSGST